MTTRWRYGLLGSLLGSFLMAAPLPAQEATEKPAKPPRPVSITPT